LASPADSGALSSPHGVPEVLISEFMDAAAVASLARRFSVKYDPQLVEDRARLLGALSGASALIVRNRTRVDPELLAGAPELRVVGRLGVGLDNIDTAACAARGIEVIPATGANADSVAEYVLLAAGVLLRRAYFATDEVAQGEWPRPKYSEGAELSGKLLGLVGFGAIGQVTARKARGLGLRVAAHDPLLAPDAPAWRETGAIRLALDELVAQADIVSLHLPLDASTRNLFDRARLERMKPGAVLVNTARGGIVDEGALAELVRAGRIGGAAIDVFAEEPLPARSPLAGAPNVLLTPHIAGVTRESNQRVSSLVAERVAAALSKE
jgi:(S)-sulfolactate dehydrogenase